MPDATDILNALVLMTNFVFVPALAYGSQLALGALGVTLVFGILRFANFAHGDLMAFGTTMVILITWGLQAQGITAGPVPTALIALVPAILVTAVAAILIDRSVFGFYRKRRAAPVVLVIASVGVMFMLSAIVRFIMGTDDRRFTDGERFIIRAREFREMTGLDEGLAIQTTQALTVIVAIVTVTALFIFLRRSRTGKAMRAYSDNEDLALLSGINPDRVVLITWIIAAALATIAGALYGLDKSFKPFTYFQLLLPIFAAAILGGIGQPIGAVVGGYIVAFSEVMMTYAYKRFVTYLVPENWAPEGLLQFLGTDYKFAVSFIILVVVLLIRPTGIFRGAVIK
ncbi:MAG: branched-chain amino acid ABC transporter permease [Roseitalea sp.]|jgi:branched-chain amino acid transport system permease protein|uniref:Branched-chain amino acid ABC transporter permease n=1 Tax=Oceaniradius stylonematis TaxID=2184161 RepID=A0A3A8AK86_9HYPH|nr:branched-chain amino acid ABC transporter permease [Oceaniradius stylonematis]MBO6553685.1 branched-chain amino acid ABC transporter permease [Roseitalea sp.]MBO6952728.1 branched-chain amino acid ABC transporter permease [Rhizobiaceae bacterium]RNC96422.1 MAG: branched-chain amino acid ABC transporter permease [Oricola sp.]MBO6592785.1 branched-chain amino acid ABC transporter permease [Roseitalea sp.]MBO6600472.1 branched-chain amino acid ABC transporter permease [Roseitalea sp.]